MLKYLIEIKNRFVLLFVTWFSVLLVSYIYKEIILFAIVQTLNLDENSFFLYFIFTNITEVFSVYLRLVLFFSVQALVFYFIYHFFFFITPALYKKEYLKCMFLLKSFFFIWLISLVLANSILIPFTWNFFLSFQNLTADYSFNLHFEAKLNEYIDFYISLCYLCIIYCNMFTLSILIAFSTISNKMIKKFRKIYYYCFLIFSTIITPPEILSQLIIGLTTIVIYELFVFYKLFSKNFVN